jgi:hypothetical protein
MPESETKQPSCLHCGTELTPSTIVTTIRGHEDVPLTDDGPLSCKDCGRGRRRWVFSTDDAGNLTLVSVGVFSEQTAEENDEAVTPAS